MAKIILSIFFIVISFSSCSFIQSDAEKLHDAVKKRDHLLVRELLESGVSVNIKNGNDTSAMELAVTYDCFECLKELIRQGGNVNEFDSSRREHLIFSTISPKKTHHLHLLVKNGADINAQDSLGYTPLITAIVLNQYDIAEFLLNKGADPSMMNEMGKTALNYLQENDLSPEFEQFKNRERVNKILLEKLKK